MTSFAMTYADMTESREPLYATFNTMADEDKEMNGLHLLRRKKNSSAIERCLSGLKNAEPLNNDGNNGFNDQIGRKLGSLFKTCNQSTSEEQLKYQEPFDSSDHQHEA
ncbi:hypothetical protein Tco_1318291 [Tanacetum coccineum]